MTSSGRDTFSIQFIYVYRVRTWLMQPIITDRALCESLIIWSASPAKQWLCRVVLPQRTKLARETSWAPSQYPKRRLSVRSRKVSKPRDLCLELSYRSEILQALRQQCCRCACQISKRYDNLKYQSRGFETLRDFTERRLFGYWDGAQERMQLDNLKNVLRTRLLRCHGHVICRVGWHKKKLNLEGSRGRPKKTWSEVTHVHSSYI